MEDVTLRQDWQQEDAWNSRRDFGFNRNCFFGDDDDNNEDNKWQINTRKNSACDAAAAAAAAKEHPSTRLQRGLMSVAACLNTLSRITVQQKLLLGLSTEGAAPEISLGGEETSLRHEVARKTPKCSHAAAVFPKQGASTCEATTCTTLHNPGLGGGDMSDAATSPSGAAKSGELRRDAAVAESFEVSQEAIVSERDYLSRLLAEAKKEMDELKCTYEQEIRWLQGELSGYQSMTAQLREVENALHLESLSAAEKIARYEEEIMTLRNLLAVATERELSLPAKNESMEGIDGAQVQCLEDALAVAAKMNTALLENAERRDLAYCSAVKEIDNLRGKLIEAGDEARHEKEMCERKINTMEREILFLRPFKERVGIAEEKLRRCAQQEKLVVKYEGEIRHLRSALREAESLTLRLQQDYASLSAGLTQAGTNNGNGFTQSNAAVQPDVDAGYSDKVEDAESSSHVMRLTHEIGRLTQECSAHRDALEALKRDHSIETDFLTARLLKVESGHATYPPQEEPPTLQREPRATRDTSTQALAGDGDTLDRLGGTSGLRPTLLGELSFRVRDSHTHAETWASPNAGVGQPWGNGVA
ncbi:uncharacterized protein Tco025E_07164 [Trypanosoma conorhini]|uniref:Uncharacterized protein n=1 Tax=Trypanosoma conorhini TaxID=83891 RepID=A0A422NSQ9_9TRYP|nr:uncharacterized protein Tco025E_07164 [Trypanosoma conorhini]RNF08469.1 hypothetical protein Tco025E_07164 [Trypanosoma conorhini]